MDQNTLYAQILKLTSPWFVSNVMLDEGSVAIIVTVSHDGKTGLLCPVCKASCSIYDTRKRHWRHLDTCQYKTLIESDVPRVKCAEHGVHTLQVPWADKRSHYTRQLEERILDDAQSLSISKLVKRFGLSWSCIDRIIQRGIQRGLSRRWYVNCKHLYVDETCIAKGREFITVMSNHQGHVIALADGRSSLSLLQCFRSVPIQCLNKVCSISMDMSSAYLKATHEFFGRRAKKLIVIDHFHIAKLLTAAVNDIRKSELLTVPSLDRIHLHKTRLSLASKWCSGRA